jgi:hypothetical protein
MNERKNPEAPGAEVFKVPFANILLSYTDQRCAFER